MTRIKILAALAAFYLPLSALETALAQAPANQTGQAGAAAQTGAKAAKKKTTSMDLPGVHLSKEIPVNFPVPQYTSNVEKKSFLNSTKGLPRASVTIQTKDKASTVNQWYLDYFKKDGWIVKVPTPQGMAQLNSKGEIYMMEANKAKNNVHFFCYPKKDKTSTIIAINWQLNKDSN